RTPAICRRCVNDLVTGVTVVLRSVLLDSRRTQARETMTVDRVLPGEELLHRQSIAAASLFERQETATDSRDNLRLAANDPAFRPGRRQVGNRQRTTVRPDDILDPRANGFRHDTLTDTKTDQTCRKSNRADLRFT